MDTENLPHDNRQAQFLAIVIAFHCIATVTVLLRLYTRAYVVRSFGIGWFIRSLDLRNDWVMASALVSLFALTISSCIYIKLAKIGYHVWDIEQTPAEKVHGIKAQLSTQLLYNPVLALTKISIILFYKRISPNKNFYLFLHGTIAFVICHGIALFITNIFQCTPVAFFWNPTIPGGSCIDLRAFYFSAAALSIAADFWILLLPQPVLFSLQLPMKKRLMLMGMFGLGIVVCIVAVLRLVALHRLMWGVDVDGTYDDAVIWSPLEADIAVMCASMPALRPLVGHFFPSFMSSVGYSYGPGTGGPTHGTGNHGRSRKTRGQSFHLDEFGQSAMGMGTRSQIRGGKQGGTLVSGDNSSEEQIMNQMGIQKTVEISVHDDINMGRGHASDDGQSSVASNPR
ncbi:hypothetical protein EDC01DRAFT_730234 [Geopyxis carbonaria]|nr:hypothetical protein EDC01DRAFT_730234 [Geopyxis carbonaria]